MLTRDAILSSLPLETVEIEVPSLGDVVLLQEPSADGTIALHEMIQKCRDEGSLRGLREFLVVLCCVDEERKPLFTEEDVKALGSTANETVKIISDAAWELVGITKEKIEDVAGN